MRVKARVQAQVARRWLVERCRVERMTGVGASAGWQVVATDVPYRRAVERPGAMQLVVVPGETVPRTWYQLRFAVGQDVRAEDRVTDLATGQRWTVVDVAADSAQVLQLARAVQVV
jgi:hypothetical protein